MKMAGLGFRVSSELDSFDLELDVPMSNLDKTVAAMRAALEPLVGQPVSHEVIQKIVTETLSKIVAKPFPFDENDIIVTQEQDICHVEYSPRLSEWIKGLLIDSPQ